MKIVAELFRVIWLTLIVLVWSSTAQAQMMKGFVPCAQKGNCGPTGSSETKSPGSPGEDADSTRVNCDVNLLFTPLPLEVGRQESIPAFRSSKGQLSWKIDDAEVLSFVGSSGNVSKVKVEAEAPGVTKLTVTLKCENNTSDQESVLIKVTCKGVDLATARNDLEVFRGERNRKWRELDEASRDLDKRKRNLALQFLTIANRVRTIFMAPNPISAVRLLNDLRNLKNKYEAYRMALERHERSLSDFRFILLEMGRANRKLRECDPGSNTETDRKEIDDDISRVDYELERVRNDIRDAKEKIMQIENWMLDVERISRGEFPGDPNAPRIPPKF